jgi:hypothetical protein
VNVCGSEIGKFLGGATEYRVWSKWSSPVDFTGITSRSGISFGYERFGVISICRLRSMVNMLPRIEF